jgi:hypothetical protein
MWISLESDVTKDMWRVAKTIRSKGQEALCLALLEVQNKANLSQTELAVKRRHH